MRGAITWGPNAAMGDNGSRWQPLDPLAVLVLQRLGASIVTAP